MIKVNEQNLLNILYSFETVNAQSFIDYLNNKNKKYIHNLCKGLENLPTPLMIEELQIANKELFSHYSDLEQCFDKTKEVATEFYNNLIRIIQKNSQQEIDFEAKFDELVQPYGQAFVIYLKTLKYKIDEVRIDHSFFCVKEYKETPLITPQNNSKVKRFYKVVLHFKKILAFYPNVSYKIYVTLASISVVFAGIGGFTLGGSMEYFERASLAASYASLAVLIAFIASFTIQLFEYRDISGKNVLAYNYKTLVNSILYQVKTDKLSI